MRRISAAKSSAVSKSRATPSLFMVMTSSLAANDEQGASNIEQSIREKTRLIISLFLIYNYLLLVNNIYSVRQGDGLATRLYTIQAIDSAIGAIDRHDTVLSAAEGYAVALLA